MAGAILAPAVVAVVSVNKKTTEFVVVDACILLLLRPENNGNQMYEEANVWTEYRLEAGRYTYIGNVQLWDSR